VLNIPDDFKDKELEVTVKLLKKRAFTSTKIIKLDTKKFTFDKEEANER